MFLVVQNYSASDQHLTISYRLEDCRHLFTMSTPSSGETTAVAEQPTYAKQPTNPKLKFKHCFNKTEYDAIVVDAALETLHSDERFKSGERFERTEVREPALRIAFECATGALLM